MTLLLLHSSWECYNVYMNFAVTSPYEEVIYGLEKNIEEYKRIWNQFKLNQKKLQVFSRA